MTINAPAAHDLLAEFDQPWRGGTPVFGCCRKVIVAALEHADPVALLAQDVTARVTTLREVVEVEMPEHLEAHRCCVGHLADLAFDLPELLATDEA